MVKEPRTRIAQYVKVEVAKENSTDCGCSMLCERLLYAEFFKNRDFVIGCKLGEVLINHYINDESIDADKKTDQITKIYDRMMANN